jgi:hypothetical protein
MKTFSTPKNPAAKRRSRATARASSSIDSISETFRPDSVTIESPGSSITHTRTEVEGWLVGMNAARRLGDDDSCRKAVAQAIEANRRIRKREAIPVASTFQRFNASTVLLCVLCVLCGFGGRTARCSEIIRGYAPQDGQQLYAADLDNLVDESVVGVQFYNDQQTTPLLGAGYYFLVLNPANQTYYRINAQQVLYGNTNIFLNAPPEPVPGYGLLLFCDPTNGWVASTTVSNFLWNSASNVNVAGLSFANTNNGGATNAFVLPLWPYPALSGLNTNFPAHFLVFDTNGVPYREGLSNLELHMASDFGTVFSLPWEYEHEFKPWQLYGTNTAAPYTNAFGWTTNFPITAYFQTNISGTNLPTLTDNDTIPVNSVQQGVIGIGPTNTSASLLSIYEYMTNKNALPPYTFARVQFSGIPAEAVTPGGQSITNMDSITGIITNIALAVNWTNPAAISWSGTAAQIPTVPQVQSNTLYWAQVTNGPVLSFQLFTNLASALARTGPITGNGVNPSYPGALPR